MSITLPRLPERTLATFPTRSCGTLTSIPSIGSRITDCANKTLARHALLDAGPNCDKPLCAVSSCGTK